MGLWRFFERRPPSPSLGEGLSPNDLLDGDEGQREDQVINSADAEERTPLFAAFQRTHGSGPYYEREYEPLVKRFHDGAEELTPSFDISSRRQEVRRSNRRQRAFHFEQIPGNHDRRRLPEDPSDRIEIAGSNERQLEPVDFSNVFIRSANQIYRDLVAVLKLVVSLLVVSENRLYRALMEVPKLILNLLIVIFQPLTFYLLLPPVGICTILGLLILNRDDLSSDAVRLYFFGLLATLALIMIISCATSRR